jgi:hypothetical protein
MRALRKHLSGWVSHIAGILKKEKFCLSTLIDELEALAEVRSLTSIELDLKTNVILN